MRTVNLIIETTDDGNLWGRVLVEDNLIVESAASQGELEANLKQLIQQYHGIDPATIAFEVQYDLEAFFQRFDYLKITGIAREAEINESLMRQYATGKKYPGKKQLERIEQAVRKLGQILSNVNLVQPA
jgi:hypothetical protein